MRHAITVFLVILLVIVAGVMLGYFSLDVSAPGGPQLSANVLWWGYGGEEEEADDEWWVGLPEGGASSMWEVAGPELYVDIIDEGPIDLWGYPMEGVVYEEVIYEEPWYVDAFPGVGSMFQQIIPGQQNYVVVQPIQQPQRVIYPQPSCWISAQPTSVQYGGSSVLQWSSFNASHASLTDFGTVLTAGTHTVQNITSERVYVLNVSGQGGSGSCYTRITVQAPVSLTPSCIISANPSVIARGEGANLAWGSNNASGATLSGVGAVPPSGGTHIAPSQSTTYTLAVFNSSGRSNSCATQVTVL